MTGAGLLEWCADLVRLGATAARISNDIDQAERLDRLARSIDAEADYRRNLELGLPHICRRTDAPAGATVGWLIRHDAVTRAARAELGLNDVARHHEVPA
jgi:hypothetical protein